MRASLGLSLCYHHPMPDQALNDNTKKMGRPATGKGTLIGVRLQPDLLAWVDTERAKIEPEPTRPEFIRGLIEKAKA